MKSFLLAICALAILTLTIRNASSADKLHKDNNFAARLSGYNEVLFNAGPPATLRGAVSTKAKGTFSGTLNKSEDEFKYVLTYQDLQADITQSHIHFGQRHTAGGIVVWLCQTTGTPAPAAVAASTPFCPGAREGTVTSTFNASQVLTVTGQGIDAGEFEELVNAIRAGAAYANVHSTLFPQGEIRGQITSPHEHRD